MFSSTPIRELRYEPQVFDTLQSRNAAAIARGDRVAHFMCGGGTNRFPVERFSCKRCDLLEPDSVLLEAAKEGAIQPAISDLISGAYDLDKQLRASKFSFRNEDPSGRTSLRAQGYQFVFLELAHRTDFDHRALADEIRRILVPGGRVVVALHHGLEIEDWAVNEGFGALIRGLDRDFRHSRKPLMDLGLARLTTKASLRAYASLSRLEMLCFALRMAGVARWVEADPFGGRRAAIERLLVRDWGRQKQRRCKVRCQVSLLEGNIA